MQSRPRRDHRRSESVCESRVHGRAGTSRRTRRDPTGEKICFQNLPRDAIVRIYSLGGELVETLYPDCRGPTGGDACWNLISRNDQIVVSGVYLYHVDSPVGEKIGKFVDHQVDASRGAGGGDGPASRPAEGGRP